MLPGRSALWMMWLSGLVALMMVSACQPTATLTPAPLPTRGPTATADIEVIILGPLPTATMASVVGEAVALPGNAGVLATLRDYDMSVAYDPDGAIGQSFVTLRNFVDPTGPYRGAWWFQDDGLADLYEVIAVVMYTEGNTSEAVQRAVAARYLWYCGGEGPACSGRRLLNFLAYFQPWREPQAAGANFTHPHAQTYKPLAYDLVMQVPGSAVMGWIPGGAEYVHNPEGLEESGPVAWNNVPFHFANVHSTWDVYLRQRLGRGADGRNRLWVLTLAESARVCGGEGFVCPIMTEPRQN